MGRRRLRLLWVFPLLFALALSSCSDGDGDGDGIATADENASASDQPGGDDPAELTEEEFYERQLAFAECMREHGIEMEDPEPGEGLELRVDGDPAQADAAMEDCRDLLPAERPGEDSDRDEREEMLAHAECMRENGVPDFPDPQEGGGIHIGPEDGLDPEDPTFQAAEEACREQLGLDPENRTGGQE